MAIGILKGNPVHEVLHLPFFWMKMLKANTPSNTPARHVYGDHPRQYYLFFDPPEDRPRRAPLIVYLHGGGWQFGAPERFTSNAAVFLERGYSVVLPSVRRLPWYDFRHFEADLCAFSHHLGRQLEASGRTGAPMVLAGMSSGAHLAAHLTYNPRIRAALEPRATVSGLILCGAPLDLDRMPNTPVIRWLTGRGNPALFRQANPRTHLKGDEQTPVLFIHGTHDGLAPIKSARSFRKALQLPPEKIKFHVLEGGTHLDAASWGHSDNAVRRVILQWLKEREG